MSAPGNVTSPTWAAAPFSPASTLVRWVLGAFISKVAIQRGTVALNTVGVPYREGVFRGFPTLSHEVRQG